MAEVIGLVAGIGSILKALTSTGIYLQGIGSASREAQEVANQVQATEAILKSLQVSLKTIHRSQEFHDVWGESTKLVLANIQTTTNQLNNRLGAQGGKARLSIWSKVKWPLDREEGLMLQQNMQAYMQMLSMVQNAFMQGNLQTAQNSVKEIEVIFTEVGTLPSSKVVGGVLSVALVGVVVASRASAYKTMGGSDGVVLASPWPLPPMLVPVGAAKKTDCNMSWTVFSQGTWKSATKFVDSNFTKARPAFATYKGELYLLHRGADDENIWYIKYDPNHGWGESKKVPDSMSANDVGACEFKGQMHVVHRGTGDDSSLWHIWFENGNWTNDKRMYSMFTASGPALADFNGALYCVSRGTEDLLWYTKFDGYNWGTHTKMGGGDMYASAGPTLAVYKDMLHCVARGTDSRLWWTKFDGSNWSRYVQLGGGHVYSSDPPSLCVFEDRLYCVARGTEGELWWTVFDGERWSTYADSGMQIGEGGPALTTYRGKNNVDKPELFCAFKST